MQEFPQAELKKLYIPSSNSHKGQNGKLMVIGGSHLFHAASLWSLEIASKIVDMVFYASVPENEKIVQAAKETFRNGIIVHRDAIESYIHEAEAVLLGPGMVRADTVNVQCNMQSLQDIDQIENEGEQTYYLTKYLLKKYPKKKWIIDAGALQMIELDWLINMQQVILTPHLKEFEKIFGLLPTTEYVKAMAQKYNCIILLKGETDIVCSPKECATISGGNAGMTKGGTGDILAGLVTALVCKNDMFLAAKIGSFINKKAGENLFNRVGYYFNATDLLQEIPQVMKHYIIDAY